MSDIKYKFGAISGLRLDSLAINKLVNSKLIDDPIFFVNGVTTLDSPFENRIIFIENFGSKNIDIDDFDLKNNLIITDVELIHKSTKVIVSENPRSTYAKIVSYLFNYTHLYWNDYYRCSELTENFPQVKFCGNVTVHKTSKIGANSYISPGVVIGPNCNIGANAIIKPNSVIGFPGFGIFKDEYGNNAHLPHVGGVIIGDDVELGCLNTICAGTIHPTVIENNVKLDDHVHIAHNCIICKGAQIAAHAEISGSVVIEDGVWLSPNVSIINGVTIGANSFVGIGACITKNVLTGTRVAGNPARPLSR